MIIKKPVDFVVAFQNIKTVINVVNIKIILLVIDKVAIV